MKRQLPSSAVYLLALILLTLPVTTAWSQETARIDHNPIDNTVSHVLFTESGRPAYDDVKNILTKYLELDNTQKLELKYSNLQKDSTVIERYSLYYNNIPVEHGSATVMVKDNKIAFIHANVLRPAAATGSVVLSEKQALNKALKEVGAQTYAWEHVTSSPLTRNDPGFLPPVGKLVWVQDMNAEQVDRVLHPAYRFDIYAVEPLSRDLIYIDAQTGKVLLKDPVIKHVAGKGLSVYSDTVSFTVAHSSINNYDLLDSNRAVSTYDIGGGTNLNSANLISSNSSFFGKSVAVDAHWGATIVFDYWNNERARYSYDGQGSDLYSVINYDVAYNNAFWNGYAMIYGNGSGMFHSGFDPLTSLDVCAHEIGHGVCQTSCALLYNKESGAMNEGFSDIWGAVIEHYGAPQKDMWSIGEEIGKTPLRSMSHPELRKDPGTYGGTYWVAVSGCTPNQNNDNCGVHTNSGVLNHWFYLLTEGGKGVNSLSKSYEVAGIGVDKAAAIAWGTEQSLNSSDDYAACRVASISVATTKYGSCSREVEAVTRAWYAVGVGADFVPCAPQVGFAIKDTVISRIATGNSCPSAKVINIPLRVIGNAPSGGNASLTFHGMGTAKDTLDFSIANSAVTFNAGSTASQMLQLTIFDHGNISSDRELKLYYTITSNGSNLTSSYTYDTCIVTITGGASSPDTNGELVSSVNAADVHSKSITPFFGRSDNAQGVFIITAEELKAAGAKPNVPISAIEFNVTQKNSTQAYANFNLSAATVQQKDLSGGIPNVTTSYFSGSLNTHTGWNRITFNNALAWNGTNDLAFRTCFSNASHSGNDIIEGVVMNEQATALVYADGNHPGCSLTFTGDSSYTSIIKPVVRVVQKTQATEVERNAVASHDWDMLPAQEVYFRNDTTGRLILRLNNIAKTIGCTNAAITKSGNGMSPVSIVYKSQSFNRSVKEFAITAQKNTQQGGHYEVTLFYDTAELSGINLSNVHILSISHKASITTMNSLTAELVKPVIKKVGSRIEFTAQMQGAYYKGVDGIYFIVDRYFILPPSESVNGISSNTGNIRVVNNPFTDKIFLNYNLSADTKADIRLFDVTGRNVLNITQHLHSGQGRFEVNTGNQLLAPGNYVLQVVTGTEVMIHKMVKQ